MNIIYCKDCEYYDTGINEEGKLFYKCLSGYNYGGVSPNDFCSHTKQKDKKKEVIKELNSAFICGLMNNKWQVPITIETIANVIQILENNDVK